MPPIHYLTERNFSLCYLTKQIADDADLDQAKRALKTAQVFFKKLVDAAASIQVEPYDLLVPKDGSNSANGGESNRYTAFRNRTLGRAVIASS